MWITIDFLSCTNSKLVGRLTIDRLKTKPLDLKKTLSNWKRGRRISLITSVGKNVKYRNGVSDGLMNLNLLEMKVKIPKRLRKRQKICRECAKILECDKARSGILNRLPLYSVSISPRLEEEAVIPEILQIDQIPSIQGILWRGDSLTWPTQHLPVIYV